MYYIIIGDRIWAFATGDERDEGFRSITQDFGDFVGAHQELHDNYDEIEVYCFEDEAVILVKQRPGLVIDMRDFREV